MLIVNNVSCKITDMERYDPQTQRLFTDCLINCREMGGFPLKDGKVFSKGRFIRCSAPHLIVKDAYKKLKDYGVRTVIDLRSKAELKNYGNPFKDDPDVDFHNIPLFVGDPDRGNDPTMVFLRTHPLGDFYCVMADTLGSEIAEVMRVLLNSEGVAMYHCAHGKDRTGVISALLYMLAGGDYEDIVLNYKVSYDYARSFLDPLIANKEEIMRHTLRSDENNMRILLDHFKKNYGGDVAFYLTKNGMSEDEVNRLRDKCLS